ncbi:MAG: hypothetical protein ACR2M5_16665, partial [Nakamurella sp.]
MPESVAEIVHTGLFENVVVRHFDWEVTYTAEQYLGLLDTFSSHIAMAAAHRDRLYSEIRRRLADRPDQRMRRHWGAVLHVAQRIDDPGRTPSDTVNCAASGSSTPHWEGAGRGVRRAKREGPPPKD